VAKFEREPAQGFPGHVAKGGFASRIVSASIDSCSTRASLDSGRAVIIFDWDDTLLCTTALGKSGCSRQQLADLEDVVEAILRTAMSLAETMIITNGQSMWVEESASRYLPRVLPTISKLRVVSARHLFESWYPEDPCKWKEAAFKYYLTEESSACLPPDLNLIAIGDQLPELRAAHTIANSLGHPAKAKTVRFKTQPSLAELVGQLRRAECELEGLLAEARPFRHTMLRRGFPFAPQTDLACALGWELSGVPVARGWVQRCARRTQLSMDALRARRAALGTWPFRQASRVRHP